MFPNLRAELARMSIKHKAVASIVGISTKAFSNRMGGRSEFTLAEMMKIRSQYFQEMSLEYLFKPKT